MAAATFRQTCLAVTATLVTLAGAGGAAQPLATQARAGWRVGGATIAMARIGNVLYLSGGIRGVAPEDNATGQAFPVDGTTGASVLNFPATDGGATIHPDGAGGWYLGGNFTSVVVNGVPHPRFRLAHVFANGTLDPTWTPRADGGLVRVMLAVPGLGVFVGGDFTALSGVPRARVGLLDAVSGAVLPWTYAIAGGNNTVRAFAFEAGVLAIGGGFATVDGLPRPNLVLVSGSATGQVSPTLAVDAQVEALHLSGPGVIHAGGSFTSVLGQPRLRLARLSHAAGSITAALDPWNPGADGTVRALTASGGQVFVGGDFGVIGGVSRRRFASLDASGTVTAFDPAPNGSVNGLVATANRLYAVGPFDRIANEWRNSAAAFDLVSGALVPWNPSPAGQANSVSAAAGQVGLGGNVVGHSATPRAGLVALDVQTGEILPWAPRVDDGSTAVAPNEILARGNTIYLAGSFSSVNGASRSGLAAVDAVLGTLLPWNPGANGAVTTMVADATTAYVGGSFTSVGGQTRTRLARINLADGSVDPSFVVSLDASPSALSLDGGRLYLAGAFTTVNGTPRARLAAVDATSGALVSTFTPVFNSGVDRVQAAGGAVYVGGSFTQVNGQPRSYAAMFDAAGVVQPWAPLLGLHPDTVALGFANPSINRIAVLPNAIMLTGAFDSVNGAVRLGVAAVDPVTGATTSWAPQLGAAGGGFGTRIIVDPDMTIIGGGRIQLADELLNGLALFIEPTAQLPLPPVQFTGRSTGSTIDLQWTPSVLAAPATSYTLEAGTAPGRSDLARLGVGNGTTFTASGVPPGRYFLRIRATTPLGTSGPSRELALIVGNATCSIPPLPPGNGAAAIAGNLVTLSWAPPPGEAPQSYLLTAGSVPGHTDIASVDVGGATVYTVASVPPGAYYLRVAAVNACGVSAPSAEWMANVGGVPTVPLPPLNLQSSSTGGTVTLTWTPPPLSTVLDYRLEAGTQPGSSNAAVLTTTAPTFSASGVPTGTYYLRVRAVNGVGASAPSNELVLIVP